jgi:DNA-binding response OmpR family regulator
MKKSILIVEDELKIARALQLELEYEGYSVEIVANGLTASQLIDTNPYDLVVLDVMLPGMNGLEVLKRVRKSNQLLPILLLTARDTTIDKIAGLDYGANDYVTKPFRLEEVVARIRALLRYSGVIQVAKEEFGTSISIKAITMQLDSHEVFRDGVRLDLTPKEYDLLKLLFKNKNKALSREIIVARVWGYDYDGESNVVDVYIRQLRKKLDAAHEESIIITVRGLGYMVKE